METPRAEHPVRLAALAVKPHRMVAQLPDQWFVACQSEELGRRAPLSVTLQGVPLALFRGDDGRPAALLDRCPHRNVPLSDGRIEDGLLECPYHGWRFDRAGACRLLPGLCGEPGGKARRAPSFATVERDGFVWVYSTPDVEPKREPFAIPHANDRRYTVVRRSFVVRSTLHAAAENALDVPHTAFLHRGLFRSSTKKRNEIEVAVRRGPDRVEAEYIGEPRPPGIAARILSPSGGIVTHFDRFILPGIAQVEYRLGEENHILITSPMTPIEDRVTRIHAVVAFRLRIPGWLVRPFLTPVALRIFRQDAWMLARQTETIQRFGGEQYVSTEIDVLGPHIWRLLKQAERGDTPADATHEDRLRMLV